MQHNAANNMSELKIPQIPQYGIIIEKEYEQSIFRDIYSNAIENVADIISKNEKRNSPRHSSDSERFEETINPIIAFVGGRGTGKSSAMSTFSSYLNDAKKDTSWIKNNNHKDHIDSTKFCCLPCIDASQFSEKETVLGRIAAEIYSQYNKKYRDCIPAEKRQNFIKRAKEVTELAVLNRTGDWFRTGDWLLENAERIGKIDKKVQQLVNSFIDIVRGEQDDGYQNHFLVISIDDLDMGVGNSYAIMEEIRKFLFIPNVIVLITLDETLLDRVLQSTFSNAPNSLSIKTAAVGKDPLIRNLSYRYIEKLMPYGRQHFMPEFTKDEITKVRAANFLGDDDKNWKKYDIDGEKMSVLDGILHLIWRKTMMIPVCDKDGDHLIVPRNLRSLCNMIIFLRSLDDVAYTPGKADDAYEVLKYDDFVVSEEKRSMVNNNINAFSHYLIENVSSYSRPELTEENDALADVLLHLIRIFPSIRLDKINVQIVGDILYHVRNYTKGCFYEAVFKDVINFEKNGQTVRDDMLEAVREYPDSISSGDVMYVLGKLDTRSRCEYIRYLVEVIRTLWSARMTQEFYYNGLNADGPNKISSNKFITEKFRFLIGGFIINPNTVSFCNYTDNKMKSLCDGTDWYSNEIFDELYGDMCKLICVTSFESNQSDESNESAESKSKSEYKEKIIEYRRYGNKGTPYYKSQSMDTSDKMLFNPMSIFSNSLDIEVQKLKFKPREGKFECKIINNQANNISHIFKTQSDFFMVMPFYSLDYLYRFYQELLKLTISQPSVSLFGSIRTIVDGGDKNNPTHDLSNKIKAYIPTVFLKQITEDAMLKLSDPVKKIATARLDDIKKKIETAIDNYKEDKWSAKELLDSIRPYIEIVTTLSKSFHNYYNEIENEFNDKNRKETILNALHQMITDIKTINNIKIDEK